MATPHKVVVTTGKTGPDRTVTGQILNVLGLEMDFMGKRLIVTVDQSNAALPPTADGQSDTTKEFDLVANASITVGIAAGVYTVTIA